MSNPPTFSIIVPTRDRPTQLAMCLAAIESQTIDDFEVVVVDDASNQPSLVAATVATMPRAKLVTGAGAGPAHARNLGADAARAPILCFLDDDCRPDPHWLSALATRFDAGADVVAGQTRNGRPHDVLATASQIITNHLSESSYDHISSSLGFAPTCNVACRRDIHAAARFDEDFPLPAGEDREWCTRLTRMGIALEFEPAAGVTHHQDLSPLRFWRQHFRYGRGSYRWRRVTENRRFQSPSFYTGLVRRGFGEGARVGIMVLAAQVATAAGMAWEIGAGWVEEKR